MVSSHSEQSHVLTISKCRCPARLSDAQRIDRINSCWWANADDLLPLEAVVSVDLRPRQLTDFVQGIKSRMSFRLLQPKQICLKSRVVQVEQYLVNWLTRCHHSAVSSRRLYCYLLPGLLQPKSRQCAGQSLPEARAASVRCQG